MKSYLLATLGVLMLCSIVIADPPDGPPGDKTVQGITIDTKFPTDVKLTTDLTGQYERLASQLLLMHGDADFRVDAKEGRLYVAAEKVEPVAIKLFSDCAINSRFDVKPLAVAAVTKERERFAERYKPLLVAWTKDRHGVPNVPIRHTWSPTADIVAHVCDVTLDRDRLTAIRAAAVVPRGGTVVANR